LNPSYPNPNPLVWSFPRKAKAKHSNTSSSWKQKAMSHQQLS
jgi:hypothetical protein